MVKVKFIKDFATKKKGEIMEVDSMLASNLTRREKVAELYKEPAKKNKKGEDLM